MDAVRLWHMSLAAAAMGDLCAGTASAVVHRVQAHVRRLYDVVRRLNTEARVLEHQFRVSEARIIVAYAAGGPPSTETQVCGRGLGL